MGDVTEFMRHRPEENEDFQMAHKLMQRYADSLVDEYKAKKENAVLLESMDRIVAEIQEIREELSEIKQQNAELTESMQYIDFTRLTVGRGNAMHRRTMPPDDDSDEYIQHFTGQNGQGARAHLNPNEDADVDMQHTTRLPKLRFEEYDSVFNPREEEAENDAEPDVFDASDDDVSDEAEPVKLEKKPRNKVVTIVSNVLFYACMALLIVGAITFAQSDDVEKSLFGFRYYFIKTASMEPVLPVGSVVLTKVTPPEDIKVGDDITVYIGEGKENTYLTHRVVEITTDAGGELAFRTKGVNNKSNDPTPFNAKLLTGKVIFCVPFLGTVMTFVQTQLIFVIGIIVLLLLLSFMLRLLFSKEEPENAAESDGEKPAAPVKTKTKAKTKAKESVKASAGQKQGWRERKAAEKQKEQEMLRKISESHAARLSKTGKNA